MSVWVVLFVTAVGAFALSAVSGGGGGLILMPILGWLLVPESVPAALSIGTAVSSVSRITFFFPEYPVVYSCPVRASGAPCRMGGRVAAQADAACVFEPVAGAVFVGQSATYAASWS